MTARDAFKPNGQPAPSSGGRHDIVESEHTSFFWPEVDDLLTNEFSRDLMGRLHAELAPPPAGVAPGPAPDGAPVAETPPAPAPELFPAAAADLPAASSWLQAEPPAGPEAPPLPGPARFDEADVLTVRTSWPELGDVLAASATPPADLLPGPAPEPPAGPDPFPARLSPAGFGPEAPEISSAPVRSGHTAPDLDDVWAAGAQGPEAAQDVWPPAAPPAPDSAGRGPWLQEATATAPVSDVWAHTAAPAPADGPAPAPAGTTTPADDLWPPAPAPDQEADRDLFDDVWAPAGPGAAGGAGHQWPPVPDQPGPDGWASGGSVAGHDVAGREPVGRDLAGRDPASQDSAPASPFGREPEPDRTWLIGSDPAPTTGDAWIDGGQGPATTTGGIDRDAWLASLPGVEASPPTAAGPADGSWVDPVADEGDAVDGLRGSRLFGPRTEAPDLSAVRRADRLFDTDPGAPGRISRGGDQADDTIAVASARLVSPFSTEGHSVRSLIGASPVDERPPAEVPFGFAGELKLSSPAGDQSGPPGAEQGPAPYGDLLLPPPPPAADPGSAFGTFPVVRPLLEGDEAPHAPRFAARQGRPDPVGPSLYLDEEGPAGQLAGAPGVLLRPMEPGSEPGGLGMGQRLALLGAAVVLVAGLTAAAWIYLRQGAASSSAGAGATAATVTSTTAAAPASPSVTLSTVPLAPSTVAPSTTAANSTGSSTTAKTTTTRAGATTTTRAASSTTASTTSSSSQVTTATTAPPTTPSTTVATTASTASTTASTVSTTASSGAVSQGSGAAAGSSSGTPAGQP